MNSAHTPAPSPAARRAFTLVELLVSVSVIALLLSILLPSLSGARSQARSAVCASNIRQLITAVHLYAHENRNRACPGAARFLDNLHRWHGTRDTSSAPFDPTRGPLVPYLGPDGEIRDCPAFRGYLSDTTVAFEMGNGGYGYNNAYIGREMRNVGGDYHVVEDDETGAMLDRVGQPAATVVFADAAFSAAALIEYSFAEPRYQPTSGFRADPSIHFRHRGHANIAWCDGHVDRRVLTFTWSSGLYASDPADHGIGWFGRRDDNHLFDLR